MESFNNLKICKYKINDIEIIFEDGTTATILAMNIASFFIEKDFINNFFTIFIIKCTVNYELYKKINTENCKYKIEFDKFFLNSNINTEYNKDNIFTKSFIHSVFINENKGDNSPDLDYTIDSRDGNDSIEKPTEFTRSQIELDLCLFSERALEYTQLNNKVICDANMFEAILALADLTNQRQLMLEMPENKVRYKNIPVPNDLTFLGAIEYLQSVYGLYQKSLIQFNDFDYYYIIDKDVKSKVYKNTDILKVYINYSDILNPNSNIYGTYEGDNYYEINCTGKPVIKDIKETSDQILGANINSVNTESGSISNTNMNNVKVLDNKYNNNYAINSFNYDKVFTKGIEVEFKEIDYELFKLNKEYYFKFETENQAYTKYDGLYKLIYFKAMYTKKDEDIFENVVVARFMRA